MPEIPNVVSGEPVEADWGNDIRDRVITRYADATARTAGLPFPDGGQVTWLDDPGRLDVFDDTDWVPVFLTDASADITGQTVIRRGNQNFITMIREDQPVTSNVEVRHRVGTQGGGNYALATGSPDGTTIPMATRMSVTAVEAEFTVPVLAPDGDETAPGHGFGQPGNGLLLVSSNRPGITAGGELKVSFRGGTYGTGVDDNSNTARDILTGLTVPDPSWGKDGDIYIRFTAP